MSEQIQKNPAGRSTKRTPEVEKILIDALSTGLSIVDACAYARITQTTFFEWRNVFPEFSESVARAQTMLIVKSAERLAKEVEKGEGDWKSALEVLKRRRRDEWGDSVSHDLDRSITDLLAAITGKQETTTQS